MELTGIAPLSIDWQSSNLPEAFEKIERHAKLMFMGPLKGKSEPEQISYLLLWAGDRGREIYSTWTDLSEEDAKKLEKYFDQFRAHVRPKLNPIFGRYKFFNEIQGEDSIDSYITRLRIRVRDCNFNDTDDMIRDRLVFGCKSGKL
jgi:hypothetical protein